MTWQDPRTIRVEDVEIRISATRTAKRQVVRCVGTHQVDALFEASFLSPVQHAAALRLLGLFTAAGLTPRSTQRMPVVSEQAEEYAEEPDDAVERQEARAVYRGILSGLVGQRGTVLDSLMHETLAHWRFGVALAGLDELVDLWGLE